ncbi:MAG: dicarboxylate/amino acid:cation symporter [Tissierellia bacterium]|nr:dicarboxylate/amino acid:cation symporter [Tissierellia bacterium]
MKHKRLPLSIRILIGLFLGIIVGLLLQGKADFAKTYILPIGTIFLNLIKLIIVPLVFASLITGVASLGDISKIGRIGAKTFLYYLFTTAFAITIGLVLATILNVGAGFVLESNNLENTVEEAPNFIEVLVNIVPANPLESLVNGDMLQIIVFAIIMGAGLLAIGEKGKIVFDVFDSIAECMYKITGAIMKLAPFGVFGLIVPVVAEQGIDVLLPLLKVIAVAYLASAVHLFVVYAFTVKTMGNMSPAKFFKGAFPAWLMAFTTTSSSGSLPVSMQCAEEDLGVSKPIASFVLPLGATINMDGTAIYQGVCAIFIAQVFGVHLEVNQYIMIILTATLASIGTAGVPGAGLIMLTMVLKQVGLPIEGIALVAGIDRILDMCRTSLNVVGDISCAVVIENSEQKRINK